MGSEDGLESGHMLQKLNKRFGQLIMIERIKLINEHQRNVGRGFVPIEKCVKRFRTAGRNLEKWQRFSGIKVQALGSISIFLRNQIFFNSRLVQERLWSKRCKDEALRGTVKEVIRQVSHSKKWKNTVPMLDENGEPVLNKSGKPVFVKSYSILQDELFDHMRAAGFLDVERGTRGSTAEHLTSLDYQVQQDEARLENIHATITKQEDKLSAAEAKLSETKIVYKKNEAIAKTYNEIDTMGKKGLGGKYAVSKEDYVCLTSLAKEGIASRGEIGRLNDTLGYCNRRISSLSSAVNRLEAKLDEMTEKYRRLVEITKPYLLALDQFPEKVRDFFDRLFPPKQKEPERELPEPKPKARHRDDRER